MRQKILPTLLLSAALLALACVTVNVYFPEDEVRDLSTQIEEAVQSEAEPEAAVPEATAPEDNVGAAVGSAEEQYSLLEGVLTLLGPSPAYADQGDVAAPEVLNPAIRKIIQSRRTRVQEINRYKSQGVLGENNQALVEVRDLAALPLQERAAVQKLVKEENADRERMFREIAGATGVDPDQIGRIRETYAGTLRQMAERGDLIQLPNGTWQSKN